VKHSPWSTHVRSWCASDRCSRLPDRVRTVVLVRAAKLGTTLGPREALLFADELDLHLLPKIGAPWMPRATQVEVMAPVKVEVMAPVKNERRYLAGAWDVRTGQVHHCLWFRKMTGLFLDLLNSSTVLTRPGALIGSMSWPTITKSTKQRPSSAGCGSTPAFNCYFCPRIVLVPIPSSAALATCTTK
jgi:hypothetical protein